MKFAIFDDIRLHEKIPYVKLSRAWSPESENVFLRQGRIRRMKGRLKKLIEAAYTTGTVTVVDGSPTVTGSSTTWLTDSTQKPLWGSDDLAASTGRTIVITDSGGTEHTHTIKSVDSATQITLDTNYSGTGEGSLSYVIGAAGTKVPTPDENPVLRYHRHLTNTGTEYFFGFTKAHVYLWNTTWTAWMLFFACGSDCVMWESVSFNRKIYATNNMDFVQVWDETTAGTAFAAVGDASNGIDLDGGTTYLTKAKYIAQYENYLHLGFTEEGGTVYPKRDRWSSIGTAGVAADFDETGTGDTGSKDYLGAGSLKGFGKYTANGANLFIVGKETEVHSSWVTTEDIVFRSSLISNAVGFLAAHSVVNDKDGNLYYVASDYTVRKLFDPKPLTDPIGDTLRNMHPDYQDYIESTFINEYNQLWWSIPKSADSTHNDKIIAWDLTERTWGNHDFEISAFGDYSEQTTYTIDTIPYTTIDGIEWATIDSVENISGFFLDMCGDYSGYTFATHAAEADDASSYTGKLVLSTDLSNKQSLMEYKRVGEMIVWFESEPNTDYTADIYYKGEDDGARISLGSVALDGNGELVRKRIPCDIRNRDFLIEIEADNKFAFIGAVFDFNLDGDR